MCPCSTLSPKATSRWEQFQELLGTFSPAFEDSCHHTPDSSGESRAGGSKRREEGGRSHPALPASMGCCEEGSGTLFMMKTITSDCW